MYAADGCFGHCETFLQPWLVRASTPDCGKHVLKGIHVSVEEMKQRLDGVNLGLLFDFSHMLSEGGVGERWSQLCVQGGEECIDAFVVSEAVLAVKEYKLVMLYCGTELYPFGQVLG